MITSEVLDGKVMRSRPIILVSRTVFALVALDAPQAQLSLRCRLILPSLPFSDKECLDLACINTYHSCYQATVAEDLGDLFQ